VIQQDRRRNRREGNRIGRARRDRAGGRVAPARVQEALGELVGAAKEGLLALSVATGLGVLAELLEEEVDDVVGEGCQNSDGA
jgi:hypothetical protein